MAYDESGWGKMYGLDLKDLLPHQLEKISSPKLLEILPNSHAETILVGRFDKNPQELKCLSGYTVDDNLTLDIINSCVALKNKYNQIIQEGRVSTQNDYYYANSYFFWKWLNDDLKKKEIQKWIDGNSGCVSSSTIDVDWSCKNCPELISVIIPRLFGSHNLSNPSSTITDLIRYAPKEHWGTVAAVISRSEKYHYLYLARETATDKEIVLGLRCFAKIISYRASRISIHAKIKHKHFKELPTVMRLEAIENMLRRNSWSFDPEIDLDHFKDMLFGGLTKYTGRIESAIKRFEKNNPNLIPNIFQP